MPPWPDLPRQAWGGIEPLAADLTAALEYGGQDQGGAHGSEQGGYQN